MDEYFPKDARASAQGLFNFLILGLGPFVGSLLWGRLGDAYTTAGGRRLPAAVPGAERRSAWPRRRLLFVGFHPAQPGPTAAEAA